MHGRPGGDSPLPANQDRPEREPAAGLLQRRNRAPATAPQACTDAIRTYGFAIPTDDALEHIEPPSPGGIVEIGAGTGYWAHLLDRRGVDVRAFDIDPAPSSANKWFAGTRPWHRVETGDHTVVDQSASRTLVIVWPTKNEAWAFGGIGALPRCRRALCGLRRGTRRRANRRRGVPCTCCFRDRAIQSDGVDQQRRTGRHGRPRPFDLDIQPRPRTPRDRRRPRASPHTRTRGPRRNGHHRSCALRPRDHPQGRRPSTASGRRSSRPGESSAPSGGGNLSGS